MTFFDGTPQSIAKSMGMGVIGFAKAYEKLKPDLILALGDRYEILTATTAALPFNIPIAHVSGGEITEGAMDEQIRHAITKMSHIHFPGAEVYAKNIKNMGEEGWRIFNVGDPGLENIKRMQLLSKNDIYKMLNLDISKKTFLVTLHPTTLNSKVQEEKNCREFFEVLREHKNVNIVITYPNSDNNWDIIYSEIEKIKQLDNVRIFDNLGSVRYLSLMKECSVVLGNSSSGIVEAPFLKIPSIDYGDRQKGRIKANSVICVEPRSPELQKAIRKALNDKKFLKSVSETKSIYGEGETSKEIVNVLESIPIDQKLIRKRLVFTEE